ncbi:MAG: HAD family hydrolase [Luminiphilus sp.]|nr:HAD family hydrolase [Luminiphilus sp.]
MSSEAGRAAVFLDRDGVINVDRGYVVRWSDFEFLPGTLPALRALQGLGYLLIIVTNQSGIGRGYYTEGDFALLSTQLIDHLAEEGIKLTAIYHCPHHPTDAQGGYRQACNCRKPAPGMLLRGLEDWDLDASRCVLVGDKPSDIAAGEAAGIGHRFYVTSGEACPGAEAVSGLPQVVQQLNVLATT